MTVRILHDNYGKSKVRLIKVDRSDTTHHLQDLTLNISLEGNFQAIHCDGDNTACLPTDTMRNTVYALAGETSEIEQIEVFGRRLAQHFLSNNAQVSRVTINIFEHGWKRMTFDDQPHEHSFVRGSNEKRTARIIESRERATVESGVEDLIVLKTTRSGFEGFVKDQYTTLAETNDRIFSTAIKATWKYTIPDAASDILFHSIRKMILSVFAGHDSKSVQHTLYAIGEAILEEFREVDEVNFSLPNIHCLPVDISKFGSANTNSIFVPTDEPHGLIEARLAR
jgi:urate oxidase